MSLKKNTKYVCRGMVTWDQLFGAAEGAGPLRGTILRHGHAIPRRSHSLEQV